MTKPPVETMKKQIEHVVVLMLENRSFDSLLGWLYEKKNPAKNVPALKAGERPYEGLQGINLNDYRNVDATGTIEAFPIRGAKALNVPNIAPGEEFHEVTTQLFDRMEMTVRGVLLAGKWRTADQLNNMTPEAQRGALIDFLVAHTNQPREFFSQGMQRWHPNFGGLEGTGAAVVFILEAGICNRDQLKGMSIDDQRNALIAKNTAHIQVPAQKLQGLSNQTLVKMGLEWFAKPTMKGYVRDYTDHLRKHGHGGDAQRCADEVMQSYTPDQLPVLNGLAEHYAVCDMWFSSVPSQTNPNRAFAYCGTSTGLASNGFLEEDPRAAVIEWIVGYKLGDDRFYAKTIFNAFDKKTTWKIYRESGYLPKTMHLFGKLLEGAIAAAIALDPGLTKLIAAAGGGTALHFVEYLRGLSSPDLHSDYGYRLFPEIKKEIDKDMSHATQGAGLDEFHKRAREGKLENFTFIQPAWTIGQRGTGTGGFFKAGPIEQLKSMLFYQGNDYHPPNSLDSGENLVKNVYESLIANRTAWEKTLLIITFDEPVGSFDHVRPPLPSLRGRKTGCSATRTVRCGSLTDRRPSPTPQNQALPRRTNKRAGLCSKTILNLSAMAVGCPRFWFRRG